MFVITPLDARRSRRATPVQPARGRDQWRIEPGYPADAAFARLPLLLVR
jgi:hypothetical protein